MTTAERARPLLGTRVAIRVDDPADEGSADEAITAAFDEIATIHRLMSFHDETSDVSRLNRHAADRPVRVDPRTRDVLIAARDIYQASAGVFDIAIGATLVERHALPSPVTSRRTLRHGTTTDIALDGEHIAFDRPLWIDLGGIAKGYAADRAATVLREHGITRGRIDAGGDIYLLGAGPHRVHLDPGGLDATTVAVVDMGEGAVATSSNRPAVLARNDLPTGVHVDGRDHVAAAPARSVSVIADRAMTADALTKVVMVLGDAASSVLQRFGASGYVFEHGAWRPVPGA